MKLSVKKYFWYVQCQEKSLVVFVIFQIHCFVIVFVIICICFSFVLNIMSLPITFVVVVVYKQFLVGMGSIFLNNYSEEL